MPAVDTVQAVKEYVRDRLKAEVKARPRGHSAELARVLKTSTAHIANMVKEPPSRMPGEAMCRKAAEYWGLSYAQLEAAALGTTVDVPVEPTVVSDRVHPVIARVGRARGFSDAEVEAATALVRGFAGTASMRDDQAHELLETVRLQRRSAERMFTSTVVDGGGSALDDLSGGRSTSGTPKRSKR